MENSPNKTVSRYVQGLPYTHAELALIERYADRRYTREDIARLFPGRTVEAVKNKIAAVRRELGGGQSHPERGGGPAMLDPDGPGEDDSWYRKQRKSMAFCNRQFVAALERYAA